MIRRLLEAMFLLVFLLPARGQEMTLQEAISMAREHSVGALKARQAFISRYWAFKSYEASLRPSISLYGELFSYDRSLSLLKSYDDGSIRYVGSDYLTNSLGLRLNQNIPLTGGTLTLFSDLSRVDQFSPIHQNNYYTQPVTVSLRQPLFSFNQFKWDEIIEPKEYERGRRTYIESMEQIGLDAVEAYFRLLRSRMDNEIAKSNYSDTRIMYKVAGERMKLGSVTRDEYLQLELRMLNDSIGINESAVALREAQMAFNSVLGLDERTLAVPVLQDAQMSLVSRSSAKLWYFF